MAGTSADYEWIRTWMNGLLDNAYCISLVRDLTVDEVLDRLGADEVASGVGVQAVSRATYEVWDQYGGERLLVGLHRIHGWVLMFEDNGFIALSRQGSRSSRTFAM